MNKIWKCKMTYPWLNKIRWNSKNKPTKVLSLEQPLVSLTMKNTFWWSRSSTVDPIKLFRYPNSLFHHFHGSEASQTQLLTSKQLKSLIRCFLTWINENSILKVYGWFKYNISSFYGIVFHNISPKQSCNEQSTWIYKI